MKNLSILISESVLQMYPETRIAYVVATGVKDLKDKSVPIEFIHTCEEEFKGFGLKRESLVTHDTVRRWRDIYQACGVKPKTYKSSIEALAIRMLKETYKPIIPVVDVYNYISLSNMLPMGGYDVDKIIGGIALRHAEKTDEFQSMHRREHISIQPEQIVYADSHPHDPVICWMWNHKDSRRTMITADTDRVLFIIDSTMRSEYDRQDRAIRQLNDVLEQLGCSIVRSGTLDIKQPDHSLQIP